MELSKRDARIYVAGHNGLVGSAIVRRLKKDGFENLLLRSSSELDLRDQRAVDALFGEEKPDIVILAAAKVGGILANHEQPVAFLQDNLGIELNVIRAAWEQRVSRLLFLGSSCVYPKLAPQPLKEEYLLSGSLEPTNQWYAIAKIAGIKLCHAYRSQYGADFMSLMPTNLYGPNDNFDLKSSHVLPALIRKFHEAKVSESADPVVLWGTGSPKREFLYIDDLADACVFLLQTPTESVDRHSEQGLINVGIGEDLSIRELATLVNSIVGGESEIVFNTSMPDGTPRKLMDVTNLNALGWKATTSLDDGIRKTYEWFLEHQDAILQH